MRGRCGALGAGRLVVVVEEVGGLGEQREVGGPGTGDGRDGVHRGLGQADDAAEAWRRSGHTVAAAETDQEVISPTADQVVSCLIAAEDVCVTGTGYGRPARK